MDLTVILLILALAAAGLLWPVNAAIARILFALVAVVAVVLIVLALV